MTQRADIVELIERVEKGKAIQMGYAADAMDCGPINVMWSKLDGANKGSVDDALSLLAHLLPGYWVKLAGPWLNRWQASVCTSDDPMLVIYDAYHPTMPSRALLLATLRAKLATMPEGEW